MYSVNICDTHYRLTPYCLLRSRLKSNSRCVTSGPCLRNKATQGETINCLTGCTPAFPDPGLQQLQESTLACRHFDQEKKKKGYLSLVAHFKQCLKKPQKLRPRAGRPEDNAVLAFDWFHCFCSLSLFLSLCVCVCAVSYTHLTLPTRRTV